MNILAQRKEEGKDDPGKEIKKSLKGDIVNQGHAA